VALAAASDPTNLQAGGLRYVCAQIKRASNHVPFTGILQQ